MAWWDFILFQFKEAGQTIIVINSGYKTCHKMQSLCELFCYSSDYDKILESEVLRTAIYRPLTHFDGSILAKYQPFVRHGLGETRAKQTASGDGLSKNKIPYRRSVHMV
jgi:hypothetical protein